MALRSISSWRTRYPAYAVSQLPLLWFVLTISPELNQARAVWVLVIVYGFLFAANTGFDVVFRNRDVIQSATIWWKRSSCTWWIAAAMFVAAAILSFLFVNAFFSFLVSLHGVCSLGSQILFDRTDLRGAWWSALLKGLFIVVTLYVGITNLPIQNVVKLQVLIPGLVATGFRVGFFLLQSQRRDSYLASWIVFVSAAVMLATYFNFYLSPRYLPGLLSIFLIQGIFLVLLHPSIFKNVCANIFSSSLLRWVLAIGLNAYFFYLFTDYTQILQLI